MNIRKGNYMKFKKDKEDRKGKGKVEGKEMQVRRKL